MRLYEEVRKIVGAIIQKITIDEYLPKILVKYKINLVREAAKKVI